MKILSVSDEVEEAIYNESLKDQFSDIDLVLACGDLPPHYLEFIVTKLSAPLLYILGNHDQGSHSADGHFRIEPRGCINVDEQIVKLQGLLIGGLEGSMRYSYQGGPQYSEQDMRLKAIRMIPNLWWNRFRYGRAIDILITHAAPFGIHDGTDPCHTGFRTFLHIMRIYRPRYLIHGHMHVYNNDTITQTTYYDTQVVNTYGYRVISWNSD